MPTAMHHNSICIVNTRPLIAIYGTKQGLSSILFWKNSNNVKQQKSIIVTTYIYNLDHCSDFGIIWENGQRWIFSINNSRFDYFWGSYAIIQKTSSNLRSGSICNNFLVSILKATNCPLLTLKQSFQADFPKIPISITPIEREAPPLKIWFSMDPLCPVN